MLGASYNERHLRRTGKGILKKKKMGKTVSLHECEASNMLHSDRCEQEVRGNDFKREEKAG